MTEFFLNDSSRLPNDSCTIYLKKNKNRKIKNSKIIIFSKIKHPAQTMLVQLKVFFNGIRIIACCFGNYDSCSRLFYYSCLFFYSSQSDCRLNNRQRAQREKMFCIFSGVFAINVSIMLNVFRCSFLFLAQTCTACSSLLLLIIYLSTEKHCWKKLNNNIQLKHKH